MTNSSVTATTQRIDPLGDQIREWLAETGATLPAPGDKAKHVRDPLHGAIVLAPAEVRLIDTLPMQRLRGIRQLGLAYLTFPSAGHSRFEHALGVRFVARQMLDRLEAVRDRAYTAQQRSTVLAAALLHDVGHGILSHATEDIIEAHPVLNAQFDLTAGPVHEQVGARLIQEHPIADCLIAMDVAPAAVAALLLHDRETLQRMGLPPELWGIISGPIDADKLDYFARDSYFSGIAAGIDPERILQTLTIGPDDQLAVTLAGAGALDQMLFDRVHMYGDLYGHQKNLAAESMVRAIVETMLARGRRLHLFVRSRGGRSLPIGLDRVTDFLRMSDEAFLAAPTNSAIVASLQDRLLRRALLHRAYTLSFEAVHGASEEDYLRMLPRLRTPQALAQLRRELIARHPAIEPTDLWVAAARSPSMAGVASCVVGHGQRPVPMGTAFGDWDARDSNGVPVHTVLRHFELYRAKIYVFCPPEQVACVRETARTLLQNMWADAPGELSAN